MADLPERPTRFDPYRNLSFKLKWDGTYVAGFSKVVGLKKTTQVLRHRALGDPTTMRRSPGQTDWDAITLERGVTHDVGFEQWANKIWDYRSSPKPGSEVSLADFRKDLTIEFFNEAGERVIAYEVYRAWPSEFTALASLDASSHEVAIESLVLQNEGWQRV